MKEIDLSSSYQREGIPVDIIDYDLSKDLFIQGQLSSETEETVFYSVRENALIIKEDGSKVQIAPANRQFQNAPLFQRMLTNIGGPLNNFILSIVAFTLMAFLQGGVLSEEAKIGPISSDSPAAEFLATGDEILEINNEKIQGWQEMALIIQKHPNEALEFKIKNQEGNIYNQIITPALYVTEDGQEIGRIGIGPYKNNSFLAKVTFGFTETWNLTVLISQSILSLFTGGFSVDDLGGPVAIYNLTGEVAAAGGFIGIISFLGFLSVNLGLMNLLPIPGLDGGKLVLNIIEGFRGKALSEEKETVITLVGVIILLALMLFITWNDIQRFFF